MDDSIHEAIPGLSVIWFPRYPNPGSHRGISMILLLHRCRTEHVYVHLSRPGSFFVAFYAGYIGVPLTDLSILC